MQTPGRRYRWSRWSYAVAVVVGSVVTLACAETTPTAGRESPPVMPPPAPSVRIRLVDSLTHWSREPAIGDTIALRASYVTAAGQEIPGRPVTSWSLERPSAYYALSSDGVVMPIRAGDGASFTVIRAVIDGVVGLYSMNYRVLGWLPDSLFDQARQRYDYSATFAARLPNANPPASRRKGLNSDWDARFVVRCATQGTLDLQLSLPERASTGEVVFDLARGQSIAEPWTLHSDGYSVARAGDARELLLRIMSVPEFTLRYFAVDGRAITGIFPARDLSGVVRRVIEGCR